MNDFNPYLIVALLFACGVIAYVRWSWKRAHRPETPNGQVLAEFHREFTFNHEHFRMRSVICRTCGFHIGAFNLYTYRDDPDAMEKIMRDIHDGDVHPVGA